MAMQKVEETAHRIGVLLGEHSPHDDTTIFFERQEFVLKSSLCLNEWSCKTARPLSGSRRRVMFT